MPDLTGPRPGRSARPRAAGPEGRHEDGRDEDGREDDGRDGREEESQYRARITSLMAQVKSASGDAKVTAMADVIAVLLEERAAMQEHCASMMSMMKK